jgi:hypothetical protein
MKRGAAARGRGGGGGGGGARRVRARAAVIQREEDEVHADPVRCTEDADRLVLRIFAAARGAIAVEPMPIEDAFARRSAVLKEESAHMTPCQLLALQSVCGGKNVAILGPAGTGKSFIIGVIKKMAADKECRMNVMVTATTGLAASCIDGTTLHSAMGIGTVGLVGPVQAASDMLRSNPRKCKALQTANVLIVDEISMISGEYMRFASEVVGHIRRNAQPFGGLQLVLLGDSLQLVIREAHSDTPWWESLGCHTVRLQGSVRQAADPVFAALLDKIRVGRFSDHAVVRHMNERRMDLVFSRPDASSVCWESALNLFSTNAEAHAFNADHVRRLERRVVEFQPSLKILERSIGGDKCIPSSYSALKTIPNHSGCGRVVSRGCNCAIATNLLPVVDDTSLRTFYSIASSILVENFYAEKTQMCIGARVMCIKNVNVESGISNGALGTVVGWCGERDPVVAATRKAMTVEERMAEWRGVAAPTAESNVCESTKNALARMYFSKSDPETTENLVPVVQMDGTGRTFAFMPFVVSRECAQGVVEVSYIPLSLAHALTVHKAQGLTLPAVVVHNTSAMCMPGQLYVAISRVPALDRLVLTQQWEPSHYSTSSRACKWEAMETTVSIPDT